MKPTIATILLVLVATNLNAQIAVKADVVHVVSGPTITNGIILMKGKKITAVGTAATIKIPNGYKIVNARDRDARAH